MHRLASAPRFPAHALLPPLPLRPSLFRLLLLLLVGLAAPARAGLPEADLELVEVATGLNGLVAVTHAGDDRLFLTEQGGIVHVLRGGALLPAPFLDLSSLMGSGFEGGMKSIAFHPDHATNGFVYVHYSDLNEASVVARYEASAANPDVADPASGVTLLTLPQSTDLHRGGQLAFGPDGYLYTAFGDGGPQMDPNCNAQSPNTFQGKMLRLDVDQNAGTPPYYGIPAGNPFGGAGEPAAEVWALGLRNPWRFSFDRETGDLYLSDVGQFNREEINVRPAGSPGGENYGWRVMEGTACFDPDPIDVDCPMSTPSCFDAAYTDPVIEYDHSAGDCSVTGGYVYRGARIDALEGRYLYGDWCSGRLWAASEISPGVWSSELLDVSLPTILTFGEDVNGELYLGVAGTLYRLRQTALFADGFESGNTMAWDFTQP